jgi:hypothetical protein
VKIYERFHPGYILWVPPFYTYNVRTPLSFRRKSQPTNSRMLRQTQVSLDVFSLVCSFDNCVCLSNNNKK